MWPYMERKYFIDNLRWMAILLLFPFHASQIWSGGEYSGFYIWSHTNTALYVFSTAVYPWYMALLFVIAGISCKYSLQIRTNRQFIGERVKKLLVPFLFGLLVLIPMMTYVAEVFFNGYKGTYFQQYGLFFTKETDLTGYRASFPVYILHMPILVVAGFFVLRLPIGVAGQFLLIVLISFVATFLIYEVVKRIPVLRFFLGIAERKL